MRVKTELTGPRRANQVPNSDVNNGEVEVTGADPGLVFHTSPASADYLRAAWSTIGADVIGRRLFDLTNGWNGCPAVGNAVFVVTHQPPTDWPYPDAPFTFVTDGLHSALAQLVKVLERSRAVVGEPAAWRPGTRATQRAGAQLPGLEAARDGAASVTRYPRDAPT